jgi:outer membrane protein assembly factor BamB
VAAGEEDEPALEIPPDVVPMADVYFIPDDDPEPRVDPRQDEPRPPVGRSVVGSTLTGLGVIGAVVAAVLPWSGALGLTGLRGLAAGRSWLIWLLLAFAAAVVLGVIALVRPGRRVRWWGVAAALAGSALSGLALVGLPAELAVGPGPGLACVALAVLAAGQVAAAVSRSAEPGWRWRPAGIAASVAVVVLVGAGLGSAGLVAVNNVDATTSAGPVTAVSGAPPSVVDTVVWRRGVSVYDVAGSSVLAFGHAEHGVATMSGVSVLDLATGRERWHHYERGWQVLDAALTGDGRITIVVVNSATGTDALGFDAATGDQLWRDRLGSGFNCTYAGKGQIAPIGGCLGQLITGDGVLYAAGGAPNPVGAPDIVGPATYVSARDGRSWPVPVGADCRLRGAGGDAGGLYVLDQCVSPGFPEPHLISEQVVGYDLTGRQRWSSPLQLQRGTVAGILGPVFVRGDVVLAEQEQRYVALNTATGAQLWSTSDPFEPEAVVTDGTRLAWASGIQVTTMDLHSGAQLWQHDWNFPLEADLPAIAGGHLYLIQHTLGPDVYNCARDATLLLLDTTTGKYVAPRGSGLPAGVGNDCGPDVQDRTYLRGSYMVLATASTITVLAGHR